jgi:hypothetical protein
MLGSEDSQIPRQCSLVYPAKIGFRQGEALGSRVDKVMGRLSVEGVAWQKIHCVFITLIKTLVLFGEIIHFYIENQTKCINTSTPHH